MGGRWPFVGRSHELELIGAAMREGAGVMLVGAAGVGKTRLAYEAVTGLDQRRHLGLWAPATSATKAIPFGALAALLPAELPSTTNPVNLLRRAGEALLDRAGSRRLVLGVDDAHLLDDMSAALVRQLAQSGWAFVLTTVRSGEPVPEPVTALWKEELATRLELATLSVQDVHAVLTTALGGQVQGTTSRRMWDAAGGNMLLLRELVNAGLDSGALGEVSGVWRWAGPWVVAPRLVEVITSRLGRLEPAEQEVLEVVAYGEPIGAEVLAGLTDQRTVLALEAKHLLWVRQDRRRVDVRLGHPLYGEVLRANTSPLRARTVRRMLADAIEATGARRRDDWLRVATWRLDASAPVRPEVLVAASRQAFAALDLPLAVRLARTAFDEADDIAAGQILGRALFLSGRAEEVEEVTTRLLAQPISAGERGECTYVRVNNMFWGLRKVEAAEELIRTSRTQVDQEWREQLDFMACAFAAMRGHVHEAARRCDRLEAAPMASPARSAQIRFARGLLLMFLGRPIAAGEVLTSALDELQRLEDTPWMAEGCRLSRCQSALLAGDLAVGAELAAAFYRHAVDVNWSFALRLACAAQAQTARLRGRVHTAARWARDGVYGIGDSQEAYFRGFVAAELAHAEALAGRRAAAEAALASADADLTPSEDLLRLWVELARPWVAQVAGNRLRATELTLAAATYARDRDAAGFEAFALHDAARLGAAGRVADRLAELAEIVGGTLVPVMAGHAAAATAGAATELEAVASRFAGLGADLLAAEAAIQAANAHDRSGHAADARRLRAQAAFLLANCEGARTPLLAEIEAPQLTSRERDIATLAADGLSNQDIADRLTISVRTVGNHLYRVYAKLGINDRSGLTGLFTGAPADPPTRPDR